MAVAPDQCPAHHLDPHETVWIDVGGAVLPYSAERACEMHHLGAAIQPLVARALAAVHEQTEGHSNLPPAFRSEGEDEARDQLSPRARLDKTQG